MNNPRHLRRALLLPILCLIAVAAPPAQEKDPADKDTDKPAAAPAEEAPAAADDAATADDAPTADEAAAGLRRKGEVISQQGDLKLQVESNTYSEFPGFDISHLDVKQRDWLLKRANAVYCTCGCLEDTVARCVVLDPTCQTARKMLQGFIERAETGPLDAEPADPEEKTPAAEATPDGARTP